jgi:hypothetical protein
MLRATHSGRWSGAGRPKGESGEWSGEFPRSLSERAHGTIDGQVIGADESKHPTTIVLQNEMEQDSLIKKALMPAASLACHG